MAEKSTERSAMRPILIVGIGNTLRRDDGAGWFFAEALAAALEAADCSVHLELHHQLTPELAVAAAELQPGVILFVDASVAVDEVVVTLLGEMMPDMTVGHSLTPATLLTLMRRLYAVDAVAWLVQAPARDFGHGEGLSEVAQRGVQTAPALALRLLDR
ncbi:MAG TPA: hydrogenase maturation protease [Chloroflexi bacterium]|nr:hydrogenase maturation protease [Chloroflexota bacterium]